MTDTSNDNGTPEFLTAAERLTDNLRGEARDEIISVIASHYANLELIDYAIELAETISDPFMRDNTLAEISAASIATGTSEYADALLEMIDDPGIRCVAIEEIAVKHAERGDLDQSLELARELDDADPALRRIALTENTFSPRAVEIALSITAPDLRASALGQLVIMAHRADRKSEEAELLDECLRSAEEIEFSENRIYSLIGIASLYEEIGDTDPALNILSQAFELCQEFEGLPVSGLSSGFPRGEALTQIVESFARLRDFDQADHAAEQIDDPFQFAHASAKEAIEYFRAGQIDQALTLLSEALELALDEPVYGEQGVLMRDSLLAELAVGFATLGHVEKSLEVTGKLSSESQRFLALQEVGKACARTGNTHGIFEAAKTITNNYSNTAYWLAVSDVLRESTGTDLVQQILLKATESAGAIQDNYEKAASLIETAYRFALMNDSKASELFSQALAMISQLNQDDKKALSLLRIDERFRQLNRRPNEEERLLLNQVRS